MSLPSAGVNGTLVVGEYSSSLSVLELLDVFGFIFLRLLSKHVVAKSRFIHP